MKTYTEDDVRNLVESNIKHIEEIAKLKDQLSKETRGREIAEKRYSDICERCMRLYITDRDITSDTLFVQVIAPRFMSKDDFNRGITQHLISACTAERDKAIFADRETLRCKKAE